MARATEPTPIDMLIWQPLRARADVGHKHANSDAIDMEPRTGGLVWTLERDHQLVGTNELGKHLGKPKNVSSQSFDPDRVGCTRGGWNQFGNVSHPIQVRPGTNKARVCSEEAVFPP